MSITIQWKGGDDIVTISSGERIGFFGINFGESIVLNAYQDKTYVTNVDGTNNGGALPNIKYVSNSPGMGNIGSGSAAINTFTSDQCTLHLRMTSGSATRIQAVKLIAYSGSLTVGPSGGLSAVGTPNATIVGFELGDTNWTIMSGSAQPLMLTPFSGAAGQEFHDYYIGLSAQPQVTGINVNISLALYAEWY
ncbi:hypothetical protein LCGC14_2991840 [marine sediment metagenome]|uniref:Uncharacterized protein n=1 Tax=marine sediment metagenome TaxID=412755 RepID=A0A0F8X3I7_9ZZZZ